MIDSGHLNIGPLRFALRTEAACSVRYSDPAYAGFFSVPVGRTVPVSCSSLCISAPLREKLFFILLIPSKNFYLSPGFASRRQAHKEIHPSCRGAFVRKPPSIPPQ